MAFNGSGTFSLIAGNPVVTGTTISSTWANNTLTDIATNGLTNCLTKDGQTTPTANITLGSFKITNLGAATAGTDAPQMQQVQRNSGSTIATVSGVTTITGSVTPTPSAYIEGLNINFTAVGANGASPTFNLNSLGAQTIFWAGATCTSSMWKNGSRISLVYLATSQSSASTTGFHLMEHSSFIPAPALRIRGTLATSNGTGDPEFVAPSADDQLPVSTASASAGIAFKGLGAIISGLTTLATTADASADFVAIYSATANAARKVTLGVLQTPTYLTPVTLNTVSATADFTISSFASQIVIYLSAASMTGTDNFLIQLGDAGGIEAASYVGVAGSIANAGASQTGALTSGFIIGAGGTGAALTGYFTLERLSADGTAWGFSCVMGNNGDTTQKFDGGIKVLSQALTTVRITRTGTDTFDAGTAGGKFR